MVTNGDVITDIRYGELLDFHIRNTATATMAVRVHEWQHPFGVVKTQGGLAPFKYRRLHGWTRPDQVLAVVLGQG